MEQEDVMKYLKSIDDRLGRIENILEEQVRSNKKLDDHIDFIDSVYDNVKKPFSRILSIYNGGSSVQIDKNNRIKDI